VDYRTPAAEHYFVNVAYQKKRNIIWIC